MTDNNIVPEAEVLGADDCWRLLGETHVGRLSVIVDGHPDIFPVNFAVDNETIVFRTGMGTKQQAMEADSVVALESDSVSGEFGIAWSVVVKGQAAIVTDTEEVLDAMDAGLSPWQPGQKNILIRITPADISGRRFVIAPPTHWWPPLDAATDETA